jgi:hypothetical protein
MACNTGTGVRATEGVSRWQTGSGIFLLTVRCKPDVLDGKVKIFTTENTEFHNGKPIEEG